MRKQLLIATILTFLSGCALLTKIAEMTPKQKAILMLHTFNTEYNRLLEQARGFWDAATTDEQRLIMRYKMALLQKVYPYLQAYVQAAETGGTPPLDLERVIQDLLDTLLNAAINVVPEGAELYPPPPLPTTTA